MIKKVDFFGNDKYIIDTGALHLEAVTLGAAVTSLRFRGRETVLRYDSAQGYMDGGAYLCAAIGRYANRIGGAAFVLNGKKYTLAANEGKNQLHGGPRSFDKRRWRAETGDDSVRFTLFSPDGDNGFPGDLTAAVTYSLRGDALRIDFEGESGADTVFAPTSHLYFNLDGSDSVLDAQLRINASRYLEVDRGLIPTGAILPAEGRFDFRHMRRVAEDYDHCFILDGEDACCVRAGGTELLVRTDFPALQVYTSSALGAPFGEHRGLALEPEFYSDSPNHPEFPSTTLKKGEKFHRRAEYRFSEV